VKKEEVKNPSLKIYLNSKRYYTEHTSNECDKIFTSNNIVNVLNTQLSVSLFCSHSFVIWFSICRVLLICIFASSADRHKFVMRWSRSRTVPSNVKLNREQSTQQHKREVNLISSNLLPSHKHFLKVSTYKFWNI
jgi:hypothetical protein